MLNTFSNKQKYTILSKTGYTGSEQEDEMEAFMQSKPDARSLVQRLERKAKAMKGIPTTAPENKTIGMQTGGMTGSSGITPATTVAAPTYSYITPSADQEIQPLADEKATTAGVDTVGTAAQATAPTKPGVATVAPSTSAPAVKQPSRMSQLYQVCKPLKVLL